MRKSEWRITTEIKWLIFIFLIAIPVSNCRNQSNADWPQHIRSSLCVIDGAKDVQYYRIAESYQVEYKVHECYPGKIFIQNIENNMVQKGWKRLDYDFLNPKMQANHAKFVGGLWDSHIDKDGTKVMQWIDDWQDHDNNYVRYGLKYYDKKEISKSTCNLEVVVIFIPAEAIEKN
jgi:hypothetical protein